jgi:GR25 family glycosyltransferase involved in LPS biosynthesis
MKIPDTIHVLGFTRNPDAMRRTCAEVERAGFKAEPFWNFPTPYIRYLAGVMRTNRMIKRNPAFLSSSLGHYSIWKTFTELGDETLFICEDDCRFVKDVELLHRCLSNHPADADILLLDTFFPTAGGPPVRQRYLEERTRAVSGWARLSVARSLACYVIGPRMLKSLIWLNENGTRGMKQKISDQWLNVAYIPDAKIYSAVPNLAVQQMPARNDGRNSGEGNAIKYRIQGTNLNQYGAW